jgi:hypothetical protein
MHDLIRLQTVFIALQLPNEQLKPLYKLMYIFGDTGLFCCQQHFCKGPWSLCGIQRKLNIPRDR